MWETPATPLHISRLVTSPVLGSFCGSADSRRAGGANLARVFGSGASARMRRLNQPINRLGGRNPRRSDKIDGMTASPFGATRGAPADRIVAVAVVLAKDEALDPDHCVAQAGRRRQDLGARAARDVIVAPRAAGGACPSRSRTAVCIVELPALHRRGIRGLLIVLSVMTI
ncbi:hypothetical protein [uncultured Albimonas sp.]|uniref:hypothetical protein n=1 Tax=uncultured Albimonas sp. TaxID=1331701 RepID=UPI0030EB8167